MNRIACRLIGILLCLVGLVMTAGCQTIEGAQRDLDWLYDEAVGHHASANPYE
jgi:hypothetical protein